MPASCFSPALLLAASTEAVITSQINKASNRSCWVQHPSATANLLEENAGIRSTKNSEIISLLSGDAQCAEGSNSLEQIPWYQGIVYSSDQGFSDFICAA